MYVCLGRRGNLTLLILRLVTVVCLYVWMYVWMYVCMYVCEGCVLRVYILRRGGRERWMLMDRGTSVPGFLSEVHTYACIW